MPLKHVAFLRPTFPHAPSTLVGSKDQSWRSSAKLGAMLWRLARCLTTHLTRHPYCSMAQDYRGDQHAPGMGRYCRMLCLARSLHLSSCLALAGRPPVEVAGASGQHLNASVNTADILMHRLTLVWPNHVILRPGRILVVFVSAASLATTSNARNLPKLKAREAATNISRFTPNNKVPRRWPLGRRSERVFCRHLPQEYVAAHV